MENKFMLKITKFFLQFQRLERWRFSGVFENISISIYKNTIVLIILLRERGK
jgi:hypothetical protein